MPKDSRYEQNSKESGRTSLRRTGTPRIHKGKSPEQMGLMRFVYSLAKSLPLSQQIASLRRVCTLSTTQIYKWIWDERNRQNKLARPLSEFLQADSRRLCREVVSRIHRVFNDGLLYKLDTIFLPQVAGLALEQSQQVWRDRLDSLSGVQPIVLKLKEAKQP